MKKKKKEKKEKVKKRNNSIQENRHAKIIQKPCKETKIWKHEKTKG